MLTARQQAFVREYLLDLNATQAAIRAGYSKKSADVDGPRLLGNARVRKAVDTAMARRAARVEIKADDVLRELYAIATCDIGEAFDVQGRLKPLHKMPESVRRAIAGIEVDELWGGDGDERSQIGQTRKVKFWSKPDSLAALGKHLKLFTDRVEHSFEGVTDEQLEARYQAITSATATKPPESGE